ncbi:MAG: PAS domain-containing protein [Gammaproteobacteria bacterium]|nr:PAS domain-containing protein [Gammaproteobacteria bacterium]
MKNKIKPTQKEIVLRDDDFIVSKTDPKGRIIYANKIFVEFSGYTQVEILNKQHNIVRHPDMPRAVFNLLWETIQSGKEFNGYVKNMSKDGSYYWVFANVTPSYNNGNNNIGYYSVRRKPSQEALNVIIPLYKEMLQAEKKAGAKDAIEASTSILSEKLVPLGVDYDQFALSL